MTAWKLYTTKKFLARTVAVVQAGMLFSELGWWAIVYVIRPSGGSYLELFPPYLGILGGNARFTFPIFLVALIMNGFLPGEPETANKRTVFGRIVIGLIVFTMLWFVGFLSVLFLIWLFGRSRRASIREG